MAVHLEGDAGLERGLETLKRNFEAIGADRQRRKGEQSFRVGDRFTLEAGLGLNGDDVGALTVPVISAVA
jgi:hypothetical protein